MTDLVILEPSPGPRWAPYGDARPLSDLRAGLWPIHERWRRAAGSTSVVRVSRALAGFTDVDAPAVVAPFTADGPAIVAHADFAPAPDVRLDDNDHIWTAFGEPVAWRVEAGDSVAETPASLRPAATPIKGERVGAAWGLLDALERQLPTDLVQRAAEAEFRKPSRDAIVLGPRADVSIAHGADVEPAVVFDVRPGPILVETGASIRSGTRLEGPCWIGPGARIVGGFVRASVIGPQCVVRGEVANSLFNGYANKAHDGFVGHSVVGHWANLGALTTTSNLKNTYGPVRIDHPDERLDTGRQFLGSLIGDHAKTAIGTMLSTGTVIGAGAHVFGAAMPARWIPAFSWGEDAGAYLNEEGFLRVAERVMPRRGVDWTAERRETLHQLYKRLGPR